MSRRTALLAGLILLTIPRAAGAAALEPPPADDPVLSAMWDEAQRSVTELRLGEFEPPFFVSYLARDSHRTEIEASFGALVTSDQVSRRTLIADVRVGSYDEDSSNFLSRDMMFGFGGRSSQPMEDDYDSVRHALWLLTDDAYKQALEAFARKQAVRNRSAAEEEDDDPVPDFARIDPVTGSFEEAPAEFPVRAAEDLARSLSGIFERYPSIQASRVTIEQVGGLRRYVSSEGGWLREPSTHVALMVHAEARSEEGARVADEDLFLAPSFDGLGRPGELKKAVKAFAERLTEVAAAGTEERYLGPVLFTGQAAGELFSQLLGSNLIATPKPVIEDQRMARFFSRRSSKFMGRLGFRVLPKGFAVTTDPRLTELGDEPLLGHWLVDDEGVAPGEALLVEDGRLKSLLVTRTPLEKVRRPSGHARATRNGGRTPALGNLFVSSEDAVQEEELRRRLLELCDSLDLDYGLEVRRIRNPGLAKQNEERIEMMFFGGPGRSDEDPLLSSPVEVWKIYPDGREERLRGMSFSEISIRLLRDIDGTSRERTVYSTYQTLGSRPGSGLRAPCSLVVPSVLVEEVELVGDEGETPKPPWVPHPVHGVMAP